MSYKACNEVLQKLYADCCSAPAEQAVRAPWGVNLNGTGRFAAVAAIENGLLGVARNSTGKYKTYYRSNFAGNWFFEMWGVWRSSFVLALFFFAVALVTRMQDAFMQQVAFAVVGLVGVGLFAGRATGFLGCFPASFCAGDRGLVRGVYPCVVGFALALSCFLAVYAIEQGAVFSRGEVWESNEYYYGPLLIYTFWVLVGSLIVSYIADMAGFSFVSFEVMVEHVLASNNYTNTMYRAADKSGLRDIYERQLVRQAGGNVLVILVFLGIVGAFACWPFAMY